MGLESIFRLSVILAMVDNLSGPGQRIQNQVTNLQTKMQSLIDKSQNMQGAGVGMLATGTAMAAGLLMPVKATMETKKAIGELASVGVKDIKALEDAATKFSNKYSGTTKAQFISASYDIKGGIASLSDTGVAEYTRLSALTAKATKATVQDMTSLFATGYGIYRDMYNKLDDMAFGQMFAGGIAQAVNIFKSTGPQMAQAMTTLGAAATTAKRPLEEQLTILGMLQATMPGGESGTKYRAFIQSAAKAGKELGLSFIDNKNQLLGMDEILLKLRSKYGATLDAIEKQQISKAFGTEEAVALIDLLYPQINQLKQNVTSVRGAMQGGTQATMQMIDAMSKDPGATKWTLVTQQFQNLLEIVGNQLAPVIVPVIGWISKMILKLQDWSQKNPEATRTIWKLVAAIATLMVAGGGGLVVLGGLGMLTGYAGQGIAVLGKLKTAFKVNLIDMLETIYLRGLYAGDALKAGWTKLGPIATGLGSKIRVLAGTVSAFGMSLLTNPITWYVVGIVALGVAIYLLIKHWDKVKSATMRFFGWLRGILRGVPDWILVAFPVLLIIKHWDKVKLGTIRFFNWFRGVLQGVPDWVLAAFPLLLLIKHFEKVKVGFKQILDFIKGLRTDWKKSGAALLEAFTEGLKSMVMQPYEVVKGGLAKLRNLLPSSDAKEGPLSRLTKNGRSLVETFAGGISQRSGLLKKVTATALAGANLIVPLAISPSLNGMAAPSIAMSGLDTSSPALSELKAPAVGFERHRESINLREIFREAVTSREKETIRDRGRGGDFNFHYHGGSQEEADQLHASLKRFLAQNKG